MALSILDPISIEAEKARRDFKLFVRLAWSVIEPGRPFVPGWHLDAIADHLQAVTDGKIKKLLVNMPPRHGKSSLISVLWPVWSWLNNPSIKFLCASYALSLAIRDNRKCRQLIQSPWFQERYGHIFQLSGDQNVKSRFENNKLGYRMAVPVGSTATGEGGDILLCLCYNAEVTTDRGRFKIGDIVEQKLPVRVLAFDHTNNIAHWQHIEKYERNPGRPCVRVTLQDGRTIDATTDHPFYVVGRGYVPTAQLTSTDEVITDESFLSSLRKRNRPSASTPCEGQERHILQSRLSWEMANGSEQPRLPGWQSRAYMRFLRKEIPAKAIKSASRRKALLFSLLQWQSEASQSTSRSLYRLRLLRQAGKDKISQAIRERYLLLSQLRQHSTQQKDEGHWQSKVRRRDVVGALSTRISDTSAIGTPARQSAVSTLPDDSRAEQQGIRRSPHRLQQRAQRANKSNNALPVVSWENARISRQSQKMATTVVRSVEPIPTPEYVYNVRVAEDHNYFANGVLVHNCDDPHNIDEKESDVKREAALDWFNNTWSTRLNDQQTGAMVVVGQRIHEGDVSGHILSTNDGGEWIHLNLSAEFEEASACKTYLHDGKEFWADLRVHDGELLWEARFPRDVIEKAKRRHGPIGYSALYGQNPVPSTGGTFNQRDERVFDAEPRYLFSAYAWRASGSQERRLHAVPVGRSCYFRSAVSRLYGDRDLG